MDKPLQDLCRLCGEERKCSFNVFIKTEDDIILRDAIKDSLHISISEGDTIPTDICSACNTFLLTFVKFKDVAEKTQLFLDLQVNLEKEKAATLSEHNSEIVDPDKSIKSEINSNFDNLAATLGTDEKDSSEDDNFPSNEVADEHIKITKIRKRYKKRATNPLENPEECMICHKRFSKERYLRVHLRQTHKIVMTAKYPCGLCSRWFMQRESYNRHIKLHDDPNFNKPLPCDECGKILSSKQTLRAHVRSIHKFDGERKFICEECGCVFKAIGSLRAHKVSHTGEYPFQCPKCDRRFQTRTNLFIHLDIHSETPYICTICQSQTTTLRGLRLHMIMHSDRKPHKCDVCGNAYKRVTALKKHLIVHSGMKPYSCNFCERTFADGSNKRIHMKRVHKKELAEMEASGLRLTPTSLPKLQQLKKDESSTRE